MNLKNRLKKIETGLNLDSEFCRCERVASFRVRTRFDFENYFALAAAKLRVQI